MKIALAQINTIVGDFDRNIQIARNCLDRARRAGTDIIVFPELTFSGYPPQDLLEKNSYIEKNLEAIQAFKESVHGIAAVVGFIDRNSQAGKPLYNSAAFIQDGRIRLITHKCLLPTYDIFDEARHYVACSKAEGLIEYKGKRVALTICEDFWNDSDIFPKRLYTYDPVEDLARQGADLFININASPFTIGKPILRQRILTHAARKYRVPVIMVNQVGGYDEIIFDGTSLVADETGQVIAQCPSFQEDLMIVDLNQARQVELPPEQNITEQVFRALVLGTRDYSHKCGFHSAVIGLSGGIDSALVACIASEALGPENVTGVAMPSMFSSPGSVQDAKALAQNLGIKLNVFPIKKIYDSYVEELRPVFKDLPFDAAEENIQARIRGNLLMALSNKFGHLLLSTGNKSEMAVGYSTLYGDMCGGLAVIADVLKTKVYDLSRWINRNGEIIPGSTIRKPPSAELRPNQTDQDELPPYDVLDEILTLYIEEQLSFSGIIKRGFDGDLVRRVITMVDRNEYKRRQAAPCLKITGKSFGLGRRFPIVQKFS